MPGALLDHYENEYLEISKKIAQGLSETGRKLVFYIEIVDQSLASIHDIENDISVARQILDQMELETMSMECSLGESSMARLKTFRNDLNRFQNDMMLLVKERKAMEVKHAREKLFTDFNNDLESGSSPSQRLLSTTESSNIRLERTQRMALEAEQIGASVLGDLRRQREQIQHASHALYDTDQDLDTTSFSNKSLHFWAKASMPRTVKKPLPIEGSYNNEDGPLVRVTAKRTKRDSKKLIEFDWNFGFNNQLSIEGSKRENLKSLSIMDVYQFKPDFETLIIHKKKLAKVQTWIESFRNRVDKGEGGILVLSGPTGCGKTACLKAICKQYNVDIMDGYENFGPSSNGLAMQILKKPVLPSLSLISYEDESGNEYYDSKGCPIGGLNQPYLIRDMKLLVFEDLPNLDAMKGIEKAIENLNQAGQQLALVVTDPCHHQSLSADPILRNIVKHPNTTHVVFNPISSTLLKMLSNHIVLDRDTDINLGLGDARAYLIDLWMRQFVRDNHIDFVRDSSYGLFHSLGKILYGKVGSNNSMLSSAEITEPDRPLFHAFLHANYPKYIGDIREVAEIADTFSFIDSVAWKVRSDHNWYSLNFSLPETLISTFASRNPSKGFKAITSPIYHLDNISLPNNTLQLES